MKFAHTIYIQLKYIQNQVVVYFLKSQFVGSLGLFWAKKVSGFFI